jgi:hypothetical protein
MREERMTDAFRTTAARTPDGPAVRRPQVTASEPQPPAHPQQAVRRLRLVEDLCAFAAVLFPFGTMSLAP